MEVPEITIITAVKNGVVHFVRTLSNVMEHPYPKLKYIVIDGGSLDGTVDVIKKCQKIHYWTSESDKGLYHALNKGWRVADNDSLILFLGAGDLLIELPEMSLLRNGETIIIGRTLLGHQKVFKSRVNTMLKFANTVHHQALLIPKRLHPEPPFDTNYKIYADFDFNQRLLKKGYQFRCSKSFLTFALPGGLSAQYSAEAIRISMKNFGIGYGLCAFLFFVYQRAKQIQIFPQKQRGSRG